MTGLRPPERVAPLASAEDLSRFTTPGTTPSPRNPLSGHQSTGSIPNAIPLSKARRLSPSVDNNRGGDDDRRPERESGAHPKRYEMPDHLPPQSASRHQIQDALPKETVNEDDDEFQGHLDTEDEAGEFQLETPRQPLCPGPEDRFVPFFIHMF